jgi:hypothetical protein
MKRAERAMDFQSFYASRTLYVFSEQLIGISMPIIIYQGTQDATLTALTFFAIWAPRCLFPVVAARIIDVRHAAGQIQAIDILRIATLLVLMVLPTDIWLLVGIGLLSLLNLWAIALFEKGLQFAPHTTGAGQPSLSPVAKFSIALRADRVALTISALISGTLLSFDTAFLLQLGAAAALVVAHLLQARSGILRMPLAEPLRTSTFATARRIFANSNLRGLIFVMWFLNGVQGAVFGALPILVEESYSRSPTIAAGIFATLHLASWIVLRIYPWIAARVALPVRLSCAMTLCTAALTAAFLAGNFVVFVFGICVVFSVRNVIDVETIIQRNHHIPPNSFGQMMTVFLPLVYLPFAVAGLLVSALFHYGAAAHLAVGMATLSVTALLLWFLFLHAAFESPMSKRSLSRES